MKTLLVLSEHPELAENVRAGLDSGLYRVLHRSSAEEAEPILAHELADACLVDMESSGVQGLWFLEKLSRFSNQVPIVVAIGVSEPEWEEEAYLLGIRHVIAKPVRPRLLNAILQTLWREPHNLSPQTNRPVPSVPVEPASVAPPVVSLSPVQNMGALRSFSGILTHSLDSNALLRQFLLQLRELFSINRAAIFIRTESAPHREQRLRLACSVGLASSLVNEIELSLASGIGGLVSRLGRIVRRGGSEARADLSAQKQFEILGGQVAVPIVDRDSVLGMAVFDARITGENLGNHELELIFHLLEQVGLALRNIWLHDQLAANNRMLGGILRELNCGCVVVSRDLVVLHTNKTARKYLARPTATGGDLQFTDLPEVLGSKVYHVLKTGAAVANLRYRPSEPAGATYNVNVVPFQAVAAGTPDSALLMLEDLSQAEQLRRLELEAADLRLLKSMADRCTAEINNSIVGISVHAQMFAERWRDADFRNSLQNAMVLGLERTTRLTSQMDYLARDAKKKSEPVAIKELLEHAYQQASKYFESQYEPAKRPQAIRMDKVAKGLTLNGDPAGLRLAFSELFLNAFLANKESNKEDSRVQIRIATEAGERDRTVARIEIEDDGSGFNADTAKHATTAFYARGARGVGLGLTVAKKIVDLHGGQLELVPAKPGQGGVVRVTVPVEAVERTETSH